MNLRERIDAYIDVPQDIRVWVCRFYIDCLVFCLLSLTRFNHNYDQLPPQLLQHDL